MKTWLRRLLMALLSDDIELIVNRELVNADTRAWLDGEEVTRIAQREIQRDQDARARASWGKD